MRHEPRASGERGCVVLRGGGFVGKQTLANALRQRVAPVVVVPAMGRAVMVGPTSRYTSDPRFSEELNDFRRCLGIVLVLDSQEARIGINEHALRCLSEDIRVIRPEMPAERILTFANKQDLPGLLSDPELNLFVAGVAEVITGSALEGYGIDELARIINGWR